jgi:hypothetical protein
MVWLELYASLFHYERALVERIRLWGCRTSETADIIGSQRWALTVCSYSPIRRDLTSSPQSINLNNFCSTTF